MANYAGNERLIDGVGVGVFVVDYNIPDDIVMVQRSDGFWALPGGKVKYGESIFEAAARELWEETGLSISLPLYDVFELVGAAESFYNKPNVSEALHFMSMLFKIDISETFGELKPDGKEIIDVRKFKMWALPEPLFPVTKQAMTLKFQTEDVSFLQFSSQMFEKRDKALKGGADLRVVKGKGGTTK